MKSYKSKFGVLALLLVIISVLIGIIAIGNPGTVTVNSYTVTDEKIPASFYQFKIGYLSDCNIKDEKSFKLFQDAVSKINEGNYDLVLFGGDLFENGIYKQAETVHELYQIKAKYGKFAVLGDKDIANNGSTIKVLLENANFEVLSNQAIPIYHGDDSILLIGCETDININDLINPSNQHMYRIVLNHRPDGFKSSIQQDASTPIHLQLSGHSHGGFYRLGAFDISVKTPGATEYIFGKYEYLNSTIIVSSGVGNTSSRPFRIFCPNDIVEVTLYAK